MLVQGSTQPVSAAAFASSHPPGNGNSDAAGPSLGRGHRPYVSNFAVVVTVWHSRLLQS